MKHKELICNIREATNQIAPMTVDDILEYLEDDGCLTKKGKEVRHGFWELFVKEDD